MLQISFERESRSVRHSVGNVKLTVELSPVQELFRESLMKPFQNCAQFCVWIQYSLIKKVHQTRMLAHKLYSGGARSILADTQSV